MERLYRFSLLLGRNVRWPRRMLPHDRSSPNRRTDVRPLQYFPLDAASVITHNSYLNKVSPQRDVARLARRAVSAARSHAPGGRQRYRRRRQTPASKQLGGPVIRQVMACIPHAAVVWPLFTVIDQWRGCGVTAATTRDRAIL